MKRLFGISVKYIGRSYILGNGTDIFAYGSRMEAKHRKEALKRDIETGQHLLTKSARPGIIKIEPGVNCEVLEYGNNELLVKMRKHK